MKGLKICNYAESQCISCYPGGLDTIKSVLKLGANVQAVHPPKGTM
jgi:hypothetical protein